MDNVSFDVDQWTADLIAKIVDRARPLERLGLTMDLTAAHANGCPIDFARLLAADDFNFWHDVGGISTNIDRTTGKLMNHFRPRFSERVAA